MSRFGDLVGGKKAAPAPEPVVEEVVEVVETFPYESDLSLHDMTKKELEEYGRTVGIELDRRHSKRRLVQELEDYLSDS